MKDGHQSAKDVSAYSDVIAFIASELAAFGTLREDEINADTRLLGLNSAIKSSELVSLLLALEDYSEERLARPFDWRSDAAFSELRSTFRTVGSLAAYVVANRDAEK